MMEFFPRITLLDGNLHRGVENEYLLRETIVALEKAPYWTDLYYHVVEHYFWRPQAIGRISDRKKPAKHWEHWKGKLERQETPLNHIIDFLFHIAPQDLLDRVISALLKRQISDLQLVAPTAGTIDNNITQPDIIVSNSMALVFVEMKVDSQSSIDQFTKYAIAAHCIMQDEPQLKSVDLVILSRHADHNRVWKNAKGLGISGERAVRETAIRGLEHDPTIWSQRGVQSYVKSNPDSILRISDRVRSMGLHLADYSVLENALREYAAKEKTVEHLIDGVLHEFSRRHLVER
jgi:hypothetical protein